MKTKVKGKNEEVVMVTLWDTRSLAAKNIFFFNDTATTEIYTLSLHDALPISWVFPILMEDNIACALSPLEYLIPLWCLFRAIFPCFKRGQLPSSQHSEVVIIVSAQAGFCKFTEDRKSTRLNSSHPSRSRMPSSA